MDRPPLRRAAPPRHARPDAEIPPGGRARSAEIRPDDVRSFDALWSDDHWERRADTESLRAWLGLSPSATLTDLPPIREEAREEARDGRPVREKPREGMAGDEEPPKRRGRIYFVIGFWALLGVSVGLWWLDTPVGSITTTGDVMLAAGQITGLAGGFVLLFQILLMSRASWLERTIGAHDLLIWHRELGGYLFFAVVTHIATTIVGYSRLGEKPFLAEAWEMITGWPDMLTATGAALLLIAVVVLCIRGVRRKMSYETWYYVHLSSYLIVVLAYAHQFSAGQELTSGPGYWYWVGLHAFVAGNLVWGRVVDPAMLNLRHRLRVVDVVSEAPGMVSLYIGGRRLPELKVRAGQYFRWRFLGRGMWWQAHPFSLSAAPNGRWLRLTVKTVGSHTLRLRDVRAGVRIFVEGPWGDFTASRRVRSRTVLIAAGSGIAPIRALLEELPPGAVVIYRAGSESDLVFREELDYLAQRRSAAVWYVLGSRTDPGPSKVFTPRGLRELVPDVRRRDVFLCGPEGLVSGTVKNLRHLRVPRRQIHLDPFEF